MPLPVLVIGALAALYAHDKHKAKLHRLDNARCDLLQPDLGREPSEVLASPKMIDMQAGTVVCCEVYEAFIHTGVVIDSDTIVELHGSGLIRTVSKKRFLKQRSGERIFMACDRVGSPLIFSLINQLAPRDVFNHYEYDLLEANCYRHTWKWLSGEDMAITTFSEFNEKLAQRVGSPLYWDVVR